MDLPGVLPELTTSVATVPSLVLSLVDLDDASRALIAEHCGVELGSLVEVDVDAAELLVPGAREALMDYWQAARALWDDLAAGRGRPDAVVVTRDLVDVRQVDTRAERRDLGPELAALVGAPDLAAAASILDANPDEAALSGVGELRAHDDRRTLTVTVRGRHLPRALGGPRSRSEVSRRLSVEASHAAWRDRRVRRFTRLTVASDEVWPRPRPAVRASA